MPKTSVMCAQSLKSLPVAAIIRAISDAAARWSDADFPARVRRTAAIAQRTGYSLPVIEFALDRLFFPLTREALEATIACELGSVDALDRFVARTGRADARAYGLERVCIISSRTTIGVALYPAVFALCAKSHVTVKDREDALIAAFFETLTEEHEVFGTAAVARPWSGVSDVVDLHDFDAVVAFGKNATLKEIRTRCSVNARWIGFPSRASAGYIAREAFGNDALLASIARGAARDLVLYDSEGCLSLHVLFIEAREPAVIQNFLHLFAQAVREAGVEFPIGRPEPHTAARLGQYRSAAAFRAAAGRGSLFSDEDSSFVLAFDPPGEDGPAFAPRSLGIIPVGEPHEALQYLRRHRLDLEAFALSQAREDVVNMAVTAGAVRLAPFGELQRLPVSGDHGGRPRIADYIRWIDKEI